MKREDIKSRIPGITDEQLEWLMGENGRDIQAEQANATAMQGKIDTLTEQLRTATDGLKAFEGVDVEQLRGQISELQGKLDAQAEAFAFDSALDGAIRDAKGRNVRAIRGMLDLDALRQSKDRKADIAAALADLARDNAWAFESAQEAAAPSAGITFSTGGEHGSGGSAGAEDGVMAAFQAMNPGLKI